MLTVIKKIGSVFGPSTTARQDWKRDRINVVLASKAKNKTFSLDDYHKLQLNIIIGKFSHKNYPTSLTKILSTLRNCYENYHKTEMSLQMLFLTLNNLFKIETPWRNMLLGVIFIDIKKAFDRIDLTGQSFYWICIILVVEEKCFVYNLQSSMVFR
jgi:hypothetical protein